jgi:hypothetical protein
MSPLWAVWIYQTACTRLTELHVDKGARAPDASIERGDVARDSAFPPSRSERTSRRAAWRKEPLDVWICAAEFELWRAWLAFP